MCYNLTDGPAVVSINLFVRSLPTISDIKMVSSVDTVATTTYSLTKFKRVSSEIL